MTGIRRLVYGPAIVLVCSAALTFSCARRTGLELFDPIVTEEVIRDGCENDIPFEFGQEESQGQRSYSATFSLGPDHPESHAYAEVTVAPAGKLLKLREYRRHKREILKLDKESPPDEQWAPALFPDIGKRAMVSFIVSPNGGGGAVVFTTNDGRYDVKVEEWNHLAEGVEGPTVLCVKIATEICRLYDSRRGR